MDNGTASARRGGRRPSRKLGTQPLDVVPPNPGSDGGLILEVPARTNIACSSAVREVAAG